MRTAYALFALSVLGIFCPARGSWPPPCAYYNPCRNGGVCIPTSVGAKCQCVGPYTGMQCETVINACSSNPCLGRGTCAVGSHDPLHWYCICPPGKTGLRCEKVIHDCSSEPCQNGGRCCENQNGYTCDCKPGFTGNYCETDIDECLSEPCQNGGTCVDQVNGYSCSCRVGLEGRHCERKKPGCHNSTCLNGGSCAESSDGMWYCVCPKTHKGIQCEQLVNDCSSHPCQNGGSCCDKGDRYECKCPDGYSGKHCETKIISPSSTSTVRLSTTNSVCPCQNGGSCYPYPSSGCACPFPYTGQFCETHYCDLQIPYCHNGGTCIKFPNTFKCICPMPYTGPSCFQIMSTWQVSTSLATSFSPTTTLSTTSTVTHYCPCQNGGKCNSYFPYVSCSCPYPFTGLYCETHYCDIQVPCHNGGTCIKSPNAFTCICPAPFTGQMCDDVISTSTVSSSTVSFRSSCKTTLWRSSSTLWTTSFSSPSFRSSCKTTLWRSSSTLWMPSPFPPTSFSATSFSPTTTLWTTSTSTPTSFSATSFSPTTTLWTTSTSTPCCVPNHGECHSVSCSCYSLFYYGPRCEFEHNPCTRNPCGSMASCSKMAADWYTCISSSVATTSSSSTTTVTLVNSHICDINSPCQHGQCIKIPIWPYYYCQCYSGYSGSLCHTPATTSSSSSTTTVTLIHDHICDIYSPCQYGQCIKIPISPYYYCQCYSGYSGSLCQISVVSTSTVSSTSVTSFSPTTTLWTTSTSSLVSTSTVSSTSVSSCGCLHGGTCLPNGECYCPIGFGGPKCGYYTDYCLCNPCMNGGTCHEQREGYSCSCRTGFSGSNCASGTSSWTTTIHTIRIVTTLTWPPTTSFKTTSTPPLIWTGHPHTTFLTTSVYSSTTALRPTSSAPPMSSASYYGIMKKRSKREARKNEEITEVEDKELKRICRLNERKARKFFSNKQLDKKTWKKLHPGIQAVLIDLVANNDHRRLSGTHAQIKNAVAQNDLGKMSLIMADRSLWRKVPVARYWKRKQLMKKAVKKPWSSLATSVVVC